MKMKKILAAVLGRRNGTLRHRMQQLQYKED